MEEKIKELDVVEVTNTSLSTPEAKVGEQGTVLLIHHDKDEKLYEVECVISNGKTKWQCIFKSSQVKLVS